MSARSHNIAVGLTVLVGLGLLGGMILLFAGMPGCAAGGYQVHVHMPDSGGAKKGDTVSLSGLSVGKLTDVAFAGQDPRLGVDLTLQIDKGVNLPVGTKAYISQGLLGGGTSISLAVGTGKQYLPTDNTAVIQGEASGIDFGKIAQSIDKLSQGLGDLLGTEGPGTSTTQSTTGPVHHNLQTVIVSLDATLASLNKIAGDEENQKNIKDSLKDLKTFLEKGTAAMEEVRKLSQDAHVTAGKANGTFDTITKATTQASTDINQLSHALLNDTDRLTQSLLKDTEDASRALNSLDRAIAAMSSGQGTTGKLITDPHLYNNLVDVSDQMSSLLKETRETLQQWKDKGIPMKLK
jgi:phospholipid/cholesterol/gamma-HCH transport system substrate-binding protein